MSVNKLNDISHKWTVVGIFCLSVFHFTNGLLQNCTVQYRPNLMCQISSISAACPKLEKQPEEWPPPPPIEFTIGTFMDERTKFNKKKNKNIRYFLPGIKMTWKPPRNIGARSITGFEISLLTTGGKKVGRQTCVTMNLTGHIVDHETQFEHTVFPVDYNSPITAMLYSLPKPEPSLDADNYVIQHVKTANYIIADHPVSYQWVFGLNLKNDSCKKEVACSFTLPPKVFNFTEVAVKLVRVGDSKSFRNKTVKLSNHHAVFEGIPSGIFYLLIEVVDVYNYDSQRCVCRDGYGQCESCTVSRSDNFSMVYNQSYCLNSTDTPDISTPESGTLGSTSMSQTHEVKENIEGGSGTWKTIVGPLGGVLIGCLLLAALCFVLKKRYTCRKCWGKKQTYVSSDKSKPPPGSTNNNTLVEADSLLKERVIYLVYTDDNSYHQRAVKLLAKYLNKYCKCSVRYPAWCLQDIQAQGPINWVLESIQKADYVLIINSEGAFKLNQARKENNPQFKLNDSPMGDIFTPAIKNIIYNVYKENAFKKYIMTQFNYSEEKFQISEISVGYKYTLMKHFRELLCHIHELNPEKPGENSQLLPLHLEDHDRTEEGIELQQAINMATSFTKNHPDWFEAMYGSDEERYDSGMSSLPLDSFPDHLRERIQRECKENAHHCRPIDTDIRLPTDLQLTFIPPVTDNDNISITQSQVTFDPPCDLYSVFTDVGPPHLPYVCNELGGHAVHTFPPRDDPPPYLQPRMSNGYTDSGRSSQRSTASQPQNMTAGLFNLTQNGNDPIPLIECDSISMTRGRHNDECNTSLWEAELARDCQIPVVLLDNGSVDVMDV